MPTSRTDSCPAPYSRARGWRAALALILGVAAARVIYLIALCPYELAADEAQYWDWSRRLDLSYYSKGPGIAWLIASSTSLFGDAEWAVRLPAPITVGVAMLAVAWTAARLSGAARGAGAAPLLASIAFCLIPGYHVAAILMTIDAPYLACWALAAAAGVALADALRNGRRGVAPAMALGAALGAGILSKYTILLLLPGIVIWLALDARAARREGARCASMIGPLLLACLIAAAASTPILIWNQSRAWPTVAHLLGHVGASGGDQPRAAAQAWSYDPMNTLSFLGTQLGILGPMAGLFVLSLVLARRAAPDDPVLPRAARFALATASPILSFYFLLTIASDVEGNWPIAAYLTLLVPVALVGERELTHRAAMVREWRTRNTADRSRRKPSTLFQTLWHWSIGYGLVGAAGVLCLAFVARLPLVGPLVPIHRLSGARDYAMKVQREIDAHTRDARAPAIIADQYTRAALLAYYLPGHPSVSSATSLLGGRKSSYDYFPDTDPRSPALRERDAILIGADAERWKRAMGFTSVELLLAPDGRKRAVYLGRTIGPIIPPAEPDHDDSR